LSISYAALVTSGTATLETALFKIPQVVCYKTSAISYFIGKMLVKLDYFSLVNLVMDAPVVVELLQKDCNKERLEKELTLLLSDNNRRRIFESYLILEEKLGGKGASEQVADLILSKL